MRAAFHTLGCKTNAYETQAMIEQFKEAGYEITDFSDFADVYIINTCSVTGEAARKSRQMLRRAKNKNPNAVVAACGCFAQEAGQALLDDGTADLVVGNNEKSALLELVTTRCKQTRIMQETDSDSRAGQAAKNSQTGQAAKNSRAGQAALDSRAGQAAKKALKDKEANLAASDGGQLSVSEPASTFRGLQMASKTGDKPGLVATSLLVDDLTHCSMFEPQHITGAGSHIRAYVKIQDGCNRFCSYCIIPFLRGRSRSRSPEEILEEVRTLAQNGIQEIVLTGIDISDFKTGELPPSEALYTLLKQMEEVEGIRRIRLGSLEAGVLSEDLVEKMADLSKLCPHFHLSLQSGCDATLKRMNRHYTTAEYLNVVRHLRSVFTNPAITTDVIAGFPMESEEEFAETLDFVQKAAFAQMHVFPYSRRKGTRADAMEGQLSRAEKADRAARLIQIGKEMQRAYMEQFLNTPVSVLTEERVTYNGCDYLIGFTPAYIRALVPMKPSLQTAAQASPDTQPAADRRCLEEPQFPSKMTGINKFVTFIPRKIVEFQKEIVLAEEFE